MKQHKIQFKPIPTTNRLFIGVNRPPLTGELNTNYFVYPKFDSEFNLYLRRKPRNNPKIIKSLNVEYENIGFARGGGQFKIRTRDEQIDFTQKALLEGLKVVPLYHYQKSTYTPFIEDAQTIDIAMRNGSQATQLKIVKALFSDLRRAHVLKIIYGDRWTKNILYSSQYGICHIDFDIEISGNNALEFEVCQVVYYTLCAGGPAVLKSLANNLNQGRWFNLRPAVHFLRRHAIHFRKTEYELTSGEVEGLIELLIK